MASLPPTEPLTVNFLTALPSRRSYSCYNCNHSFYITPVPTDATSPPPTSFRCPCCFARHLIPRYTVVPPPPPPPITPPPPTHNTIPTFPISTYNLYDDEDDDEDEDEEDDDEDEDDYEWETVTITVPIPNHNISPSVVRSFISSLPVVERITNPNSNSCSICMEEFDFQGERVVVELECKHCFHKECIWEWLKRSNTCPMCRINLPMNGRNAGPVSRRVNEARASTSRNGGERRGSSEAAGRDGDGDTMMGDAA